MRLWVALIRFPASLRLSIASSRTVFFIGHDRSIRTSGRLWSPDCFAFSREYEDIVDGVAAGKHRVEVEDCDFSYGVYTDGVRVICFAEGRTGYREWARRNGRLADIHSIDDRYDHDVDELLAKPQISKHHSR
jgi:hypothetical protein